MVDDGLVDDLCTACRSLAHADCDWSTGCCCAVRLGPDGRGIALCDSLMPYVTEENPWPSE